MYTCSDQIVLEDGTEVYSPRYRLVHADATDAKLSGKISQGKLNITSFVMSIDYGIGGHDWDEEPTSMEDLGKVLHNCHVKTNAEHYTILVFCRWDFCAKVKEAIELSNPNFLAGSAENAVWYKTNKPPKSGAMLTNDLDYAVVGYFNDISGKGDARPTRDWRKQMRYVAGVNGTSRVWSYDTGPIYRDASKGADYKNPVQCPLSIEMMRWWVLKTTAPGDIVADFFAGTGTFGTAAMSLGRNAVFVDRQRVRLCNSCGVLCFWKVMGRDPRCICAPIIVACACVDDCDMRLRECGCMRV